MENLDYGGYQMKELKRKAIRVFLGAEIACIALYYLFGSFGLQALRAADRSNHQLLFDIKVMEAELDTLSRELDERKDNPFYKETIARKELQMAYDNEIIYFINRSAAESSLSEPLESAPLTSKRVI